MRDQWLDEHMGDEARPTEAFASALADTLQSEWRHPTVPVVHAAADPRRGWVRPMMMAAAVVTVLGGGVYVVGRDSKPRITENSTVTTAAPTTPTSDANTLPTETLPATTVLPTTIPTNIPTSLPATPLVAQTPEEQTVLDYLTALAEHRYADAAKLLGEGGLSWTERTDLRPLLGADGALNSLPDALQAWCESPAMCQLPTSLASAEFRVVATFTIDGVERSSTFVGATFEGSPLVQGLPLLLPPEGVSLADTVECPTENVDQRGFADLNGDGWDEAIVTVSAPDGRMFVCGTTLTLEPYVLGEFESIAWSLDIEGDRTDELAVATSLPDGFTADVVALDGGRLVATGQKVAAQSPLAGAPGKSFGCEDMTGDGLRELVLYSYQYEGGTDLSNSTALTFSRTVLKADGSVNPLPLPAGRYELPAQEQQAFRLIANYCGDLPVQTG